MENRGTHSLTHQKGSDATPSPTTEGASIIKLIDIKTTNVISKVDRWAVHSVICRMLGSRPNRGELVDLLQATMNAQIDIVREVHFLRKGFYHVEI